MAVALAVLNVAVPAWAAQPATYKLVCADRGSGGAKPLAGMRYEAGKQDFGFDLIASPQVTDGACQSDQPFFLSLTEPDGDYRVTVVLGSKTAASVTTVKAEARRLISKKFRRKRGRRQSAFS